MRRKMTPEEVKNSLKKEIIRLGIQDNPSMKIYQKLYRRGVAPSPRNAMKVTGMKWQELMNELGFEYSGKKNKMLASKKNHNSNLAPRYNYDDPIVRKEIMDRVLVAMKNNNYTKPTDLEKNLKKNIDINYTTLQRHGFTWGEIILAYKKKYSEPVVNNNENSRVNWTQFTNKELLDMVTKIVVDYKLSSVNEYRKKFTGKRNVPNVSTLNSRLGVNDKELWRMIQVNGNLPIK
ncbi:hypothetical protein AB9M75_04165 [Lactobacillus sp. AN1001]